MSTIYTSNGPARVAVFSDEAAAWRWADGGSNPMRVMLGNYDYETGGQHLVCTPRDAERLYRDGYEYARGF